MERLVEIHRLYFKRNARTIFSDIDLFIPSGKITAIMGPSGCGKTTLLRLIGGQLKPDGGTITINGKLINNLSRTKLYELR
ncbi:MAG: ATP-binding cassette domain-containing protein, partial [Rickettsiella sp.]|nr:ATP-binding cassette domain-containing protein [Rickettsiella sp.]